MSTHAPLWALGVVAFALLFADAAVAQPYVYTQVAHEHRDGLGTLDPDVRAALAEDGTVLFSGQTPAAGARLFAGDGGALRQVDVEAYGLSSVASVAVNAARQVAFTATRVGPSGPLEGVYTSELGAPLIATLYEGAGPNPANPAPSSRVVLSESGLVAFSTIRNGGGALYHHPFGAPLAVLRAGSGDFFNNGPLDANERGNVALQMEYFDPTRGLSRGVLVFDAPNQGLGDIDTAVEKGGVGFQVRHAINNAGDVAFYTNTSETLRFYDPPNDPNGTLVQQIVVGPGVYIASPTAFGRPSRLVRVATRADGYQSFSDIDINDDGALVFAATRSSGARGIYRGPDPVADAVVEVGDVVGRYRFSAIQMGQLSHSGALALVTQDGSSMEHQVWRVDGFVAASP